MGCMGHSETGHVGQGQGDRLMGCMGHLETCHVGQGQGDSLP